MRGWQHVIAWVLAVVLTVGVAGVPAFVPEAVAATSTSFSPSSVSSLPATITITTSGISSSTTTASLVLVFPSTFTISNLSCVGIFTGANPVLGPALPGPSAGLTQQSLGCFFAGSTTVSGTSGNVMQFTLGGSGTGTVSFQCAQGCPFTGPPNSQFVHQDLSAEGIGTPGQLVVGAQPPPSGTLVVCKQVTTPLAAAQVFTFTTPPGGPTIPSITVPANSTAPVCATGVTAATGTVAVTETVPSGFTLQSVTGGTLSGNTATATITAGQTTTLTFINAPSTAPTTGTLVVCKQLTGHFAFAQAFTFAATSVSGAVTVPMINVPANTTAPQCAAGVSVPAGSVTVSETALPSGFTLQSATVNNSTVTPVNNTVTATITAGQTTTVTFINAPPTAPVTPTPTPVTLPVVAPILPPPPPPLQVVPPPPPPLLPPPPQMAPVGAPRAAAPEVPVIPEADTWVLLGVGLLGLGGISAWRRLRRPRG